MHSLSREVSIRQLRSELRDVLGRVTYVGERIGVTRNGALAAVIVSLEDLEKLERHEATVELPGTGTLARADAMIPWRELRREMLARPVIPYPLTPDPTPRH